MPNRRAFSLAAASALLAPATSRAQAPPSPSTPTAAPSLTLLPSPNLVMTRHSPPKFVAGLRPHRTGTYRLETETVDKKFVVHNYGHGGAGITMSWGCAQTVLKLLGDQRAALKDKQVAVLGAGVIGLTTAVTLQAAGYDVSIYAEKITPNTTSDVAGGQWAPSVVEHDNETTFRQLLKLAYAGHLARGPQYGVSERINYTFIDSPELDYAAPSGAEARQTLARLPFAHVRHAGFSYPTLLVEPPVLMKRLMQDLAQAGIVPTIRTFKTTSEVAALPGSAVVNCLGLGAREVWSDNKLQGIKGLLAWLPPQPNLTYLYSGIGYLFPRSDHLVVGGSIEDLTVGEENTTPDPAMGYLMIKIMQAVFDGGLPAPPWLSGIDRLTDKDLR
jgi:glycine/D-amino acid oxidase-like deaminating enzyme